jgi:ABC-type dipeptide/oligopeptide/nickel transport system permease subunit
VGVPPSTPSWGSMLNSGRNYLLEAPYLSLFPGLALFLLVIGINLIGEGLRIQFDPEH